MFDLNKRVVIVTGAAKGIGAEISRYVARCGGSVVLTDVDLSGRIVAEEIGGQALFLEQDVAEEECWEQVLVQAKGRFGRLDALVNNAGVYAPEPLQETSRDEFERHYRIDQLGPFLGMKAFANALEAGQTGSIVNISSGAGMRGGKGRLAYTAMKWAVRGMSRAAARDLADRGIRVNCIFPGMIDTTILAGLSPGAREALIEQTPLGRIGSAAEIAQAVAFLVSDASSFVTGAELRVDGGFLA